MPTRRWSLDICGLHFLRSVDVICWLLETMMETDLSPLQPPKRHGSCPEPSRQQEYISHRWHTLPQLWRTATEVNIPLISFATSSDHHTQATWRNMLWSLFSRFDTSTGALVWNRKLSTHSSKLILYATRLFKAQFVLSSCALGTTVNYSCKASCELWQLDQIRYRPRHPEEEKKINVNKCDF